MQIIAKKMLREFWESPKSPQGAEESLQAWYKVTEAANWRNFAELRETFRSTDKVGDCYVFDVQNNDIRLIAFVKFAVGERRGIVFVRKVMTHPEYDKNTWPDDCGCHKPKEKKKDLKTHRPVKSPRGKKGK